jgi:peroxiredoxin
MNERTSLNSYGSKEMITMTQTLQLGQRAPKFTLTSTTKDQISLSDYIGSKNVLVAFFPLAFTPG